MKAVVIYEMHSWSVALITVAAVMTMSMTQAKGHISGMEFNTSAVSHKSTFT
jgi:hypothetical protein